MTRIVASTGLRYGKTTRALKYVEEQLPAFTLIELRVIYAGNYGLKKPYNIGVIKLLDQELAKRGWKMYVDINTQTIELEKLP